MELLCINAFNFVIRKEFTLSLLLMTQAFVDYVDQDHTAENMQSDLWSTVSTLFILGCN